MFIFKEKAEALSPVTTRINFNLTYLLQVFHVYVKQGTEKNPGYHRPIPILPNFRKIKQIIEIEVEFIRRKSEESFIR